MTDFEEYIDEEYNKGFDLSLWRRFLRFMRPYRRDFILLALSGIGTALMDVSFPLLTRAAIDSALARAAAVEAGGAAAATGYATTLVGFGLGYLGLTAGLAFCIWALIWLAGKLRTHISHDIRQAGFERLQELSFSFYDRKPVGWLMARMTSDCERLANVFAWGILDSIWAFTLLTAITGVMLVIDWQLGLTVLVVVPVVIWVSIGFRKRILKTARVVRKTNSRLTASYNESIMGVRTCKVLVREEDEHQQFQGLSTEMFQASVRNALHSAVYLPVVLTLGSLATGLALAAGGFDVTAGRISIGTLIAFMTYTRQFFDPIQEMAAWFAEMQMAQASAERIMDLIDTEPEIQDSPAVRERIARHRAAGSASPALAEDGQPARIGHLAFEGVGFAYAEGPPILEDFTLTVAPGETIALVGATGGGKTTIVNLLCRFYEPTAGTIRIDGVDYRERSLHWLQSSLGIVLQEPHLFSGTVAENIRYGALEATETEIEEAAQLAGAHDFITDLEDGYATDVGEGGDRLSTGQKQLVSFARAILARPRILVMDEATSSVDTETEQRIQAGIERVLGGRTSFVIAHRLSTIRAADRILVIEQGRILEHGTHGELLAQRGRYHDLYCQQSLREARLATEQEATELEASGSPA